MTTGKVPTAKVSRSVNRNSPKYLEARQGLHDSLRPIYDRLVEEYVYFTTVHYGRGYVAYQVLASLVQSGWRPTETPRAE